MRFRRREPLFSVLLDTGLHLLDSVRGRLPDAMDDVKGRVGIRMAPHRTASTAASATSRRGRVAATG